MACKQTVRPDTLGSFSGKKAQTHTHIHTLPNPPHTHSLPFNAPYKTQAQKLLTLPPKLMAR